MRASVVIRVRDEAAALTELLARLARQTAAHEVIVVDNASRDGSAAAARAAGATLVHIDDFTYGRALNRGVEQAAAPVTVALSAHAFPREDTWLERMAAALDDPTVACAYGAGHDWTDRPLTAPVRQDGAMARAFPEWGYSNGSGAFRTALWRERPFREDMPFTEDREWALWALEAHDAVCVIDPALAVDHDHSRDSLRVCFARHAAEARGYRMYLDLPDYGVADAAREWWTQQGWHRSRARARLDPRRAARLAGKWWGRR